MINNTTNKINSVPHVVIVWLIVCFAMVLTMIIIGATTRLTDSGLSMVEWRPLYGFLPPLNYEEWQRIFTLYKQTPEYLYQNADINLSGFKKIFFWEYVHRLWGRLIGIIYTLPLLYFWRYSFICSQWHLKLFMLFILGALQGIIGWWMVKSGLQNQIDVSAFRLMIHFGNALIILLLLWGLIQQAYEYNKYSDFLHRKVCSKYYIISKLLLYLIFITMLSGALVAGNDAGLMHNDWPLMSGKWIAEDYIGNNFNAWFEHHTTVQLHHRLLAYFTFICVTVFNINIVHTKNTNLSKTSKHILCTLLLQIILGIITLQSVSNVTLAILHHINGILLLLLMARIVFLTRAYAY